MASRNKLPFWLLLAAGLIILVTIPMVTGKSWPALFEGWLDEYNEAAERADGFGDEDDEGEEEEGDDGSLQPLTVTLDDEAVEYAGVDIMPVKEKLFFPEIKAFASVVDVRELIQWRSRLNQLQSALTLARVSENSSRQELERLKKLAGNTGSVASKNVNYAEASWQEARANLQAARFQLEDAETELKQSWGQVIAAWIIDKDSKEFERLVNREDSLLLVTVPVDESLPADVSVIRVSREADRDAARKAYYVSPAYVASQVAQGETYYFRIATGKLRLGMRLDAWIPQNDEPLRGFHIPEQAIVWYAGQPWSYIKQDEATYKRRSLVSGQAVAGGIFIQSGFEAGEELVISGSQMLLSEEFRWQIHGEDDD